MGRPRTGPRPDSKASPVLYAHLKTPGGRYLKTSLRTTDMALAWERYPAAMQRLRAKATQPRHGALQPIKPTDTVTEWQLDEAGNLTDRGITYQASDYLESDQLRLTWPQALELHKQRQHERRGRTLAASTVKAIQLALKDCQLPAPQQVTPKDVRCYIARLKFQGLAATTVAQRCALIQSVLETLVRQDLMESNPFRRVDHSARSTSHHREATAEELTKIMESGDPALITLALTGLRVGELVSRTPAHLEGGWLSICDTDDWRLKARSSERKIYLPMEVKLPTVKKSAISSRLKQISPTLSAHGLRHAFKTRLRELLIPTELANHLMGHADSTVGSVYGSFSPDTIKGVLQKVWEATPGYRSAGLASGS